LLRRFLAVHSSARYNSVRPRQFLEKKSRKGRLVAKAAPLLERTIRVEADLVDQLFNSSEKRLARALLLLANFGKEGRPEPILAKISQKTLAEMTGTTRARVSLFMNKFRRLRLNYNGHIEIHSSLLNVILHEKPHIER
jgi:CRP/FNR family cyclic AMP-dependent transcriptional regulator